MSVCPSFDQCVNPACEANRCCMNGDYWAAYWRNKVALTYIKKESKIVQRVKHTMPPNIFCCYCKCEITEVKNYTKEHLVPRSKGGNNTKLNLQSCCKKCNNSRGSHSLQMWIRDMMVEVLNKKMSEDKKALYYTRIESALKWIKYITEKGPALYRSQQHYDNRSLNYKL